MQSTSETASRPPRAGSGEVALLTWVALLGLLVHLVAIGRYGWFRDELYYAACARHLAFGYVDHPPLVALVAWAAQALLGHSLFALRIVAALAGSLVVFLAGWLARELGGGPFAQLLAACCTLVAPAYLLLFHIYTMNALEVLLWTCGALVIVRLLGSGEPRLWLAFGALAGLGLETKHTMLLFGFAVCAGMLLTPARRLLACPWLAAGGALALVLFLPNLLWQIHHGWPTLEFARNAQGKLLAPSVARFLAEQIGLLHPLSAPVWLAGLAWLLGSRAGRPFRALGWTYLVCFAALAASNGKGYYLMPIYPLLFGAGGVAVESALARLGPARERWLRPAIVLALAAGGALLAPLAVPLLPVSRFIPYSRAVAFQLSTSERIRPAALPQIFADMFGWPEMAAEVARVYHALPAAERRRACIFAQDYGQAGAIDEFGPARGLPSAISGHNSYFLWGPRDCDGSVLVVIGGSEADNRRHCRELEVAGRIRCQLCRPEENDLAVSVCRGLAGGADLRRVWKAVKHYG